MNKDDAHSLALRADNAMALAKAVRAGLSFAALRRFQKSSQLGLSAIARAIRLPLRTLARRKQTGRLSTSESDRLLRLSRLFDGAVELFEGDLAGARAWLSAPNKALAGESPLTMAETEVGSREVEDLIGRLEHGVYS